MIVRFTSFQKFTQSTQHERYEFHSGELETVSGCTVYYATTSSSLLERTMSSSSNGYAPKSDLPWAIGSAIGTAVGLVWVYRKSSSVAAHHTEENDAKRAAKHAENSAPAATPLKENGKVEAENTASENESLNGPEIPEVIPGADDLEFPETDATKADETVDSVKEALDSGVSTVTRASEEAKSSDSDDFVKVEKEDANPARQHQQDTNVTTSNKTTKKASSSERK